MYEGNSDAVSMKKSTSIPLTDSDEGSILVDSTSKADEESKSYSAGIVSRNVRSKGSCVTKADSVESESCTLSVVESSIVSDLSIVLGRRVRFCFALSSY